MVIRSIEHDGHAACIEAAADCLREGRVVCYPTETFYALGARYDHDASLERIAALKGRPAAKSFSLIIGEAAMLPLVAGTVDPVADSIIRAFWPAPLTVVFPAREGLTPLVRDGRNTVAVRMPAPSFALDLARAVAFPITATSANPTGKPPAGSAEDVAGYFPGGIDLLIDGGTSSARLPSTIIEVRDGHIVVLREGEMTEEQIRSAV